jgi:CxxC motif-containing protein (DUF1111 family)
MSKFCWRLCALAAVLVLVVTAMHALLLLGFARPGAGRAIPPAPAGELGQARQRAIVLAGAALFEHEWQPYDPLCQGGDGLGPVFNAISCVACHKESGPGGSGGLEHNVTVFTSVARRDGPPRQRVVHAHGIGVQETLQDVHRDLPPLSRPTLRQVAALAGSSAARGLSQRNTPALFGAGLIHRLPEDVILRNAEAQSQRAKVAPSGVDVPPVGRTPRLADGRFGRFGWKAQMASLADFVQAACANELGLSNPGHPQPRPLGWPDGPERGTDLSQSQCDQLTAFVAALPRPVERLPPSRILARGPLVVEATSPDGVTGKHLFVTTGCADCHTPDLGRVGGIYSDLLLHDMGRELAAGGTYYSRGNESPGNGSPSPGEWRTPPGVADSAPYLHDGRAATREEAIRLHGGQGRRAAQRFEQLPVTEQAQLVAFLKTLRGPGAAAGEPPGAQGFY